MLAACTEDLQQVKAALVEMAQSVVFVFADRPQRWGGRWWRLDVDTGIGIGVSDVAPGSGKQEQRDNAAPQRWRLGNLE